MVYMKTSLLFVLFGLFHGGIFQEISLKAYPTYTVIGPGPKSPAVLECTISGDFNYSSDVHSSWLLEDSTILAFDDIPVKSNSIIPTNDYASRKMLLTFTKPHLENADKYICQLMVKGVAYKGTVNLYINQLPTVSIKQLEKFVVEGDSSTVSSCYAALSKPASTMWYENQSGEKIETSDVIAEKTCSNDVVNSSLTLTKSFDRSDQQNAYYCVISHPNRTEPYRLKVPVIDIYFAPSAKITYPPNSDIVLRPEASKFDARCETSGNPSPDIKWSFAPDVIDNNDDNSNSIDNSSKIPNNFVLTEENHQLFSYALRVMSDGKSTNNGTFTCVASNQVSSASDFFQLQVYKVEPTTTPTTTTAASLERAPDNGIVHNPDSPKNQKVLDSSISNFIVTLGHLYDLRATTTQIDILTGYQFILNTTTHSEVTPQPQTGPMSASVIAGVVAVAVFVIIVVIILLLRYFMSHKGEYYTNELKSGDGRGSESLDDDDGLPACEEDLLGERKRKEHFL